MAYARATATAALFTCVVCAAAAADAPNIQVRLAVLWAEYCCLRWVRWLAGCTLVESRGAPAGRTGAPPLVRPQRHGQAKVLCGSRPSNRRPSCNGAGLVMVCCLDLWWCARLISTRSAAVGCAKGGRRRPRPGRRRRLGQRPKRLDSCDWPGEYCTCSSRSYGGVGVCRLEPIWTGRGAPTFPLSLPLALSPFFSTPSAAPSAPSLPFPPCSVYSVRHAHVSRCRCRCCTWRPLERRPRR